MSCEKARLKSWDKPRWKTWYELRRRDMRRAVKSWEELNWDELGTMEKLKRSKKKVQMNSEEIIETKEKVTWEEMRTVVISWGELTRHEMRRDETRWDEVRWGEMRWKNLRRHRARWDEMRWDEMRWDEMRWGEVRWGEVRWVSERRRGGGRRSSGIQAKNKNPSQWCGEKMISIEVLSYQCIFLGLREKSRKVDFNELKVNWFQL